MINGVKVIRSQFRILLAAKEHREGRSISLREVVRTTGVPISTVVGMANNTIKRVPLDELNTLCEYLDCEVGELLKREEVRTKDTSI
ncbi:MAG: helix-turn-helix transcriptional regulator [Chloroflexota bacterium]|nr:helix-turn-helix transcriptional regulator [Chloroflexota bacterium]